MFDLFEAWTWVDWTVVATGLLYVLLAAKGERICWIFGIISCALIAREDYFTLKLYSDGILQLVYIVLGVVGLVQWKSADGKLEVLRETPRFHFLVLGITLLAAIPLGAFFKLNTDAEFPWLDAWTTWLSLAATWLTVRRVLENWLYWILADVLYVYLYIERGAQSFALLFIVYTIISIYGWFSWKKLLEEPATI